MQCCAIENYQSRLCSKLPLDRCWEMLLQLCPLSSYLPYLRAVKWVTKCDFRLKMGKVIFLFSLCTIYSLNRYFATKIGKSAKLIQRICVCFYALPDLVTYYITSEKKSVICQQWHYQVATISIFFSTSLKLQNKTAS